MKTTKQVIKIGAGSSVYWQDLWQHRELFYFLVWRDILVRYKQTTIGIFWALLRPLLTMIVLSVVFGSFANLPSPGGPYPIFVFAAMLPWQFYANGVVDCGNSLINDANLVAKVYFPRLIVPISAVFVSFVDFVISGMILLALMIGYNFVPTWRILALPLFILIAFALIVGVGLWFAALNVQYRDFRYIVPFVIQFGIYVSPVGFSTSIVPEQWQLLYYLNPMVGVIDGFRWSILTGDYPLEWQGVGISILFSSMILTTGISYFRRIERKFADVI